MKRQFSLGTVFRMSDKSLLRAFFESFSDEAEGIGWEDVNRRNIHDLQHFFDALPPQIRAQAEVALRNIHALACEKGMEALVEAAATQESDEAWTEVLLSTRNLYSKSLFTWLYHREVFEFAGQFFEVDARSWWRKRIDLPKITPQLDDETRENLEDEIEMLLKTTQGRGYTCTVEMTARAGGVYYFFAHPDDYVRDSLVHDDTGELIHQPIRQTFEVVFAYNSMEGSSELSARLPQRLRESLEAIFLRHVLGVEPVTEEQIPYDLSMLLDPRFEPVARPEDRLEIFVNSITLDWNEGYTISYLTQGSRSIREFIFERIQNSLDNRRLVVKKARFRFVFYQETGRPKTLTFEIGAPFTCTLKNQAPEHVEMAHRYLKQWRIEHDENIALAGSLVADALPAA
ncbi:MAG: hypothetical protein ACRC2T_02715 [Thermoguttaceae bacterium]